MFPCTKCGSCCKRVGQVIALGLNFPYKTDENGVCEMLTEDNTCRVYESRPDICRIDEIAKMLKKDRDRYYKKTIRACNEMMDEDDVPQEFRIKEE